jgi:hypothetical protein
MATSSAARNAAQQVILLQLLFDCNELGLCAPSDVLGHEVLAGELIVIGEVVEQLVVPQALARLRVEQLWMWRQGEVHFDLHAAHQELQMDSITSIATIKSPPAAAAAAVTCLTLYTLAQ